MTIELKNISKTYQEKSIFQNLNLTINEKQRLVILGPSGCGKTTILNILAHLIPFSGQCPKLKCSYVFDQPTLLPNLTVYQNLFLVNQDKQTIKNILQEFQMETYQNAYPLTLSKGQKHRVELMRALIYYQSELLLMDEPFSSLDLPLKINLITKIKQLTKDKTVAFVTHNLDEALFFGDRIVILNNSQIVLDVLVSKHLGYGKDESMRQKIMAVLLTLPIN